MVLSPVAGTETSAAAVRQGVSSQYREVSVVANCAGGRNPGNEKPGIAGFVRKLLRDCVI
jgi:hypothetical protein